MLVSKAWNMGLKQFTGPIVSGRRIILLWKRSPMMASSAVKGAVGLLFVIGAEFALFVAFCEDCSLHWQYGC